ncbi:MAG: IPTL-CTERM sorting domain-containing protein [Thermodesulfobacteriota bacterium]
MRFKSKILLSVFCLVLTSFAFMSFGESANAQDYCCNNNSAQGGDGQCVPAPNGAQNCNGAALTFFEDGVNGIVLAPLGPPPNFPQSGDLCPNPAPRRDTCMCIDGNGATVACQDLPPPPTNPPPTNPPPTDPPPTDPPPTNPPPTDPPPTNPPPTDPPPTNPPPTNPPPTDPPPTNPPPTDPPPTNPPPTDPPPTNPPPTDPPPTDPPPTNPPPTDPPPTNPPPSGGPGVGCCVEAQGVCSIEAQEVCTVPPNLEFMGIGSACTNQPLCVPPPTDPPPTNPPATPTPTPIPITGQGCCVEDPGICHITETADACPVPPYFEYVSNVSSCENVAACEIPPPPTEVPTMSQWGLIATAVMLGLFSLLTVRRGFRINNK